MAAGTITSRPQTTPGITTTKSWRLASQILLVASWKQLTLSQLMNQERNGTTPNRAAALQLPSKKTWTIMVWPLTKGWRKRSHLEATLLKDNHLGLEITHQRQSCKWQEARMRSITMNKCWRLSRDNVKRVKKLQSSQGTSKKDKDMQAPSSGIMTFFNRWPIPKSIWQCWKPYFRSRSKARFWSLWAQEQTLTSSNSHMGGSYRIDTFTIANGKLKRKARIRPDHWTFSASNNNDNSNASSTSYSL